MSADPEARFTGVYETYYGRVRAYAARRVGADAADEVTAEVFTIAWRRLRDPPEEPLPWLYRVAANVAKRYHQQHARDRDADQALRLERPPSTGSEPEWPGLWEAWSRLSPGDQEVLALTAWEELPARDAAAVLGCSAAVFGPAAPCPPPPRTAARAGSAERRQPLPPFGGPMSKHTTTMSRLASANPVRSDDELGRSPAAQATLRQILAEEREPDAAAPAARRPGPTSRRLVAVLAVLVLGAGTAVAATDPFGWWSSNPQTALYQTDLGWRVTPPTAKAVNCRPLTGGLFRCGSQLSGRPYRLIDHVQGVHSNPFSRSAITASVNQALQAGRITPAIADRIRADLSHVSDQYLATLYTPHGYGSYGLGQPDTGHGRVPPAGVPSFLACQMSAGKIICRDLNGDQAAPAGSGIYEASPTADWRPAPPARTQPSAPARATPTPAQMQLLSDILR